VPLGRSVMPLAAPAKSDGRGRRCRRRGGAVTALSRRAACSVWKNISRQKPVKIVSACRAPQGKIRPLPCGDEFGWISDPRAPCTRICIRIRFVKRHQTRRHKNTQEGTQAMQNCDPASPSVTISGLPAWPERPCA
jgi:hypothetical protein